MKTKNMRKKALLSSVAMLLVAVVALSGATYAWFTANTSANVSGLQLTTNKTSNLTFSNAENGTYTPGYNFNMASALTVVPVSTVDGTTFYKVTTSSAAPEGNDKLNTIVTAITAATADTDYINEDLWVKCSVDANLKISSIVPSGLTSNIRVSITPDVTGGSTIIYSAGNTDAGTANGIKAGASELNVKFGELYGSTGYTLNSTYVGTQTVSSYTSSNPTIVALSAGTAVKLTINVWLEGNNEACNDTLAGETMDGLTIAFTTAS